MNPSEPRRLETLLASLFDDELTDAELAELEQILLVDAEARDKYAAYVKSHALLTARAAGMSGSWDEAESSAEVFSLQGEAAAISSTSDSSKQLLTVAYWREHRVRFSALALALTLLLWGGFILLVKPDAAGPGSDPNRSGGMVAQITKARDASWADGAKSYDLRKTLEAGDNLELTGGFVEITFADGAVVLLEGPVDFTIDTRGAGTLDRGRLVARIEKSDESPEIVPFSVTTRLAEIIDVGTEFGVEAESDGTTNVEVFRGFVDAMPRGPARTPQSQSLRLGQGQAARITPSEALFQRHEGTVSNFVQDMPSEDVEIITPKGVTADIAGTDTPENLINGSGLTTEGPISSWTHTFQSDVEHFWKAGLVRVPCEMTFDLGREYELERIWVWNYSHYDPGYVERCVRELRVSCSSDGVNFTTIGVLELEPFAEVKIRGQSFGLHARARYVRIEVLSTYFQQGLSPMENSEVGLGEIRFEGVPAESESTSEPR